MKIDMFTEIQDPRPWRDGHEHERIAATLEQARLADRLGYGCWWQVEHHGAEEFSLSSAPELMLAALSQCTSRIRLGHAAILAPGAMNHPIRIAERAATLDHLSGGRVELGLTRSAAPEWRLFGVDPAAARGRTAEAFAMIPALSGPGGRPGRGGRGRGPSVSAGRPCRARCRARSRRTGARPVPPPELRLGGAPSATWGALRTRARGARAWAGKDVQSRGAGNCVSNPPPAGGRGETGQLAWGRGSGREDVEVRGPGNPP